MGKKWEVQKPSGILKKDNKVVKKDDLDGWAEYYIYLTSMGEDPNDLPQENDNVPFLADIIFHVQREFAEELMKAESVKLTMLKGKLLTATKECAMNPSKENKELLTVLDKAYSNISKNVDTEQIINIEFYDKLPKDFWEVKEPEHPMTDEEKELWAKLRDEAQA